MKNRTANLIILLAVLLVSCKKIYLITPPSMPAETHTGKNTFGCYVNGEFWVPQVSVSPPWTPRLSSTFYNGQLRITALKVNRALTISLTGVTDTGKYDLAANGNSANLGSLDDNATSGSVDLKFFDPANRIASGTFSFVGDGLSVTQGRFDVIIVP